MTLDLACNVLAFATLAVFLSGWVWNALRARHRATAALRQLGFAAGDGRFVGRFDGTEVEARLVRRRAYLYLEVLGPRLPDGVPEIVLRTTYDLGKAPSHALETGDAAFDDGACVTHPNPPEGLAWLDQETRSTIQKVLPALVRLTDGRWRCELPFLPNTDLNAIVTCLSTASRVMARRPAVDDALADIACQDPMPLVRRRAVEGLAARGALCSARAQRILLASPPLVQLAVVETSPGMSVEGWRMLRGTSRGLAAALAVASHVQNGNVELSASDHVALIDHLIDGLADAAHGGAAATAMVRLARPDTLRCIGERYPGGPPRAARGAVRELQARQGAGARGALSVVSGERGSIAIAES